MTVRTMASLADRPDVGAVGYPRVLVIVPAYNEEANLPRTLADLRTLSGLVNFEVVVVDDGSTDSTSKVAIAHGVACVRLPFNLGIGGAVQTGLLYAIERGYDIAIQFDADGQHLAGEIPRLLMPLLNEDAQVVVGSRFRGRGEFRSTHTRRIGIVLLSRVVCFLCRQTFTDVTSGFRAFNKEAIEFLGATYPCDYPEPETLVLLNRNGFRLTEVAVEMRSRQLGHSSIRGLAPLYYMLRVMLALFMNRVRKRESNFLRSTQRLKDAHS